MANFLPFGPFYVPRRLLKSADPYQICTDSSRATRAHHGKDIHRSVPGVYCRFCGKAIRLSRAFIMKKTVDAEKEETSVREFSSSLFRARCRSCQEEATYTLGQIVEFPDRQPETS